jgi:hypothetical protein
VLLVELAPPAGADIGLVALDLALGQRLAAKLDSAVAGVVYELHLASEVEVGGGHVAREKLVAFEAGGAADDLAVLDGPETFLAVPAC